MFYESKLTKLGYTLPVAPKPLASYASGVLIDGYIYVSGQLPIVEGKLAYSGRLGEDCSLEDAVKAAEICALNCLGVLKSLAGELDNVEKIVKVGGFVNSSPNFTAHPTVVNGASDLLQKVFAEAGLHSRIAVGVAALPLNACCEVEMIAKLKNTFNQN